MCCGASACAQALAHEARQACPDAGGSPVQSQAGRGGARRLTGLPTSAPGPARPGRGAARPRGSAPGAGSSHPLAVTRRPSLQSRASRGRIGQRSARQGRRSISEAHDNKSANLAEPGDAAMPRCKHRRASQTSPRGGGLSWSAKREHLVGPAEQQPCGRAAQRPASCSFLWQSRAEPQLTAWDKPDTVPGARRGGCGTQRGRLRSISLLVTSCYSLLLVALSVCHAGHAGEIRVAAFLAGPRRAASARASFSTALALTAHLLAPEVPGGTGGGRSVFGCTRGRHATRGQDYAHVNVLF